MRLGNLPLLEIAEESFPFEKNDMKNNAPLSTQQFKIIKKVNQEHKLRFLCWAVPMKALLQLIKK